MSFLKKSVTTFCALLFLSALLITSCKRELTEKQATPEEQSPTGRLTVNPYSLSNVKKAIEQVAARENRTAKILMSQGARLAVTTANETAQYPTFVYLRFNPTNMTGAQLAAVEADTTIKLMDFPFGNPEAYADSLDEAGINALRDGNIYVVAPSGNPRADSLLFATNLQAQALDTLVQIPEEDTTLQMAALETAGLKVNLLGICLLKRPHGYVRYWDPALNNGQGAFEPVRGMQVWALAFGIPIHTYTDANGYYEVPWRFSAGTIMGTHAKNSRVNIKPLDTHGTLVQNIATLTVQFITGSIHIGGWVGSCTMRDGKDFNFSGHTQVRYWSQLLNAYYFHDQYAAQDNILKAPQGMTCYAQWANDINGVSEFGNASAPMLNHITGAALIPGFLQKIIDEVNALQNFPSLFNLLGGVLPDMTFRVPQAAEPAAYTTRLVATAFHELGHASFFRQVGASWYTQFAIDLLPDNRVTGNPYGTANIQGAGRISLAESWAEYIGQEHALRRYPNGQVRSTNREIFPGTGLFNLSTLIEQEFYFFGGSWMPYGVFHDMRDPYSVAEPWDNVSGASILQMYNTFSSSVTDWCGYISNFAGSYGGSLGTNNIRQNFVNHNQACGVTSFGNQIFSQAVQKNNCSAGEVGTFVTVNIPANRFRSVSSQTDADAMAATFAQSEANRLGDCVSPPITVNANNTTNRTMTLTFTRLSTNVTTTFTVNPGSTFSGTIPSGVYNVFMTPSNATGTYPIVYSINGITQQYYATVMFGSYLIQGTMCTINTSPPPSIPVNITNTTTKTMQYTLKNLSTNVDYNFSVAPNGTLAVSVPQDNYQVLIVPVNYSNSYPVVYKVNNSTQVYYATVVFGNTQVNSPVTISTSPPPAVPVNVSNSTTVNMQIKCTNLATNYDYILTATPGTATIGNIPEGNYSITITPASYSASSPNYYTLYNSTQVYYAAVTFGGINATNNLPISIHK